MSTKSGDRPLWVEVCDAPSGLRRNFMLSSCYTEASRRSTSYAHCQQVSWTVVKEVGGYGVAVRVERVGSLEKQETIYGGSGAKLSRYTRCVQVHSAVPIFPHEILGRWRVAVCDCDKPHLGSREQSRRRR